MATTNTTRYAIRWRGGNSCITSLQRFIYRLSMALPRLCTSQRKKLDVILILISRAAHIYGRDALAIITELVAHHLDKETREATSTTTNSSEDLL